MQKELRAAGEAVGSPKVSSCSEGLLAASISSTQGGPYSSSSSSSRSSREHSNKVGASYCEGLHHYKERQNMQNKKLRAAGGAVGSLQTAAVRVCLLLPVV